MMEINSIQACNFRRALAVAPDRAARERLAFAIWSESAGYIYANDGTNESGSPGFSSHPEWPDILRRSINIPHDKVGANGRSTGMLQQISADVGGDWGDMAGTMDPAESARRLLAKLKVTDNGVYQGFNLRSDGTREFLDITLTPIAADVLRVQQPLADEAKSDNYNAAAVAIAVDIAAAFSSSPTSHSYLSTILHWS